jgi:hypothetical protein
MIYITGKGLFKGPFSQPSQGRQTRTDVETLLSELTNEREPQKSGDLLSFPCTEPVQAWQLTFREGSEKIKVASEDLEAAFTR